MTKKALKNTQEYTKSDPVNIDELEHRVKVLEKAVFSLAEQIHENHNILNRYPDSRNPHTFVQ